MEKKTNEELLHDISAFLESAGCDDFASGTDAEGFPFESIDDFDILPIGYEEESEILFHRTEDLFVLCQHYGRHSKRFLDACSYLDQSIRSLASVCITRIVFVKNGKELPELHNLSTHKLFEMASFTYRKINGAMEEDMREKREFPMPLMGMLLRYHQTLERLRATEHRIYKINSGEINGSDFYKKANTFSEKSPNRWYTPQQNEVPAFRGAISFPVIKSEIGNQKSETDAKSEIRNQKSETNSEFGIRNSEEGADDSKADLPVGVYGHSSFRHHSVSSRTVPVDT